MADFSAKRLAFISTERVAQVAAEVAGAGRDPSLGALLHDLRFNLFFDRILEADGGVAAKYLFAFLFLRRKFRSVRFAFPRIPSRERFPRVVIVNHSTASHYRRIEERLARLLTGASPAPLALGGVAFDEVTPSFGRRLALKWHAVLMAVKAARALHRAGVAGLGRLLTQTFRCLSEIGDYLHNRRELGRRLRGLDALFFINENWMPNSLIIRSAHEAGVDTFHYPHGMIGLVNLPLSCRYQLFWNEKMRETFERSGGRESRVVGFLEAYGTVLTEGETSFEVLLSSQFHARNHPYPNRGIFGDFFRVWRDALRVMDNVRCVIKLHPSDGAADKEELERVFGEFEGRVRIARGDEDPARLMDGCRVHSTVTSGTLLWSLVKRKPTLIYGHEDLLKRNLAFPLVSFRDAGELVRLTRQALALFPETPLVPAVEPWLTDSFMEESFRALRAGVLEAPSVSPRAT